MIEYDVTPKENKKTPQKPSKLKIKATECDDITGLLWYLFIGACFHRMILITQERTQLPWHSNFCTERDNRLNNDHRVPGRIHSLSADEFLPAKRDKKCSDQRAVGKSTVGPTATCAARTKRADHKYFDRQAPRNDHRVSGEVPFPSQQQVYRHSPTSTRLARTTTDWNLSDQHTDGKFTVGPEATFAAHK